MLWKWYKEDPDQCHYIFGTMHTSSENAYAFAALAEKYISLSTIYAAEMDMDSARKSDVNSHFLLQDGLTLDDLFKPKRLKKIRNVVLKSFGVDLDNFKQHTPFFINNMLAATCVIPSKKDVLDHHLWNYAVLTDKQRTGLETVDEQIDIMHRIPLESQVKSLKSIAGNSSAFRKKIKTLDRQYGSGDVRGLYHSTRKNMGSLRKLMIFDRNVIMTDRMVSLAKSETVFAAVGAAHLYGKSGMLALLQREGYTLRRLRF